MPPHCARVRGIGRAAQLAVRQRATVRPRGWMSRTPRCPRCVWGVPRLRAWQLRRCRAETVSSQHPPTGEHLSTPGCPLSLVVGAVSPCVQRWEARHPPPALEGRGVFARSVVAGCAHQLYRCREGWRRAARGWVDAACWCSHRGATERQTLATGTGLVRAREGVVIDRYVGRIVHGSVPGCRSHPRSTERRLTRLGVWGVAQVVSLFWWHW